MRPTRPTAPSSTLHDAIRDLSARLPATRRTPRMLGLAALAVAALAGCTAGDGPEIEPQRSAQSAQQAAEAADRAAEAAEAAQSATPKTDAETKPAPSTPRLAVADDACEGGLAYDDGQLEAAYGFVPQADWGIYLQEIDPADLGSRSVGHACVCWLHNRKDGITGLDFELVFYEATPQGGPAEDPYATVPVRVKEGVPYGKVSNGRFYGVDFEGIELPEGTSYAGVKIDPGDPSFFFLCADQTEENEQRAGYQREDEAPAWADLRTSRDPMFRRHRALMMRFQSEK